jgi:hypothetical protein
MARIVLGRGMFFPYWAARNCNSLADLLLRFEEARGIRNISKGKYRKS